jgi:hypothetical protein
MSGYLDYQRKVNKERATELLAQAGSNMQRSGIIQQLFYPQDLFSADSSPFILFFAVDPTKPDVLLDKVALYMPRDIQVNYGINYGEATNYLQYATAESAAGAADALTNLITGGSAALGGVAGAVGAGLAGAGRLGRVLGGLSGFGLGALTAFKGSNAIGQTARLNQKRILNPHKAALFEGVNFRRHLFQFDLIARNAEESETINSIIRTFKVHAHPEAGNPNDQNSFFYWPSAWQIGLYSPARKYLYAISTSHITNISVNYTSGGIRSFFSDTGAPVAVKLAIEFMETEQLTRERIRQGY